MKRLIVLSILLLAGSAWGQDVYEQERKALREQRRPCPELNHPVRWELTSCTTEECKEQRLAEGWEPMSPTVDIYHGEWKGYKARTYRYWFRRVKGE